MRGRMDVVRLCLEVRLRLRLRLSRRVRRVVLHFAAVVEDGDEIGDEVVVGSNAGEE